MPRKTFTFEGKRYDVTAKTEEELCMKVARKKIELEEGKRTICKNTLCKDWIKEWLDTYKEPAVSYGWLKILKRICAGSIIPEIGNMQLKSIKPIHLQKILNQKSDCSRSYIKKIHSILGDIFENAYQNGLIVSNPAKNLAIPQGKKEQPRRSITPLERKYILKTCEKHPAGLFVKIMLYCGLRPGEVAALKWIDINLKNKTISINKALKKDGSIGDPKSAAGVRKVPVPDKFCEELKTISHEPFDNVCTSAKGKQLTEGAIRHMWDSFIYELNIEMGCRVFKGELVPPLPVADDLVMYCLRHTYCTDLQAAGVPINVARELMGHSSITITARIYTHSSKESFEDAAAAINALANRRDEGETVGVDVGVAK